ncbi:hypothetical protein [Mesorhizobium sp. B2-4-13]|nr:hypothetical protein [Mesorhizobium sp. B2-4-13]
MILDLFDAKVREPATYSDCPFHVTWRWLRRRPFYATFGNLLFLGWFE